MNSIRKIIRNIINEVFFSPHFYDRIKERLINISEIEFPDKLRQELNKNNLKLSTYEDFILETIKKEVNLKISLLKNTLNKEQNVLYIYVIAKVLIKYKGSYYSPTLKSTDDSKLEGNIWYAGSYNDYARTLLLRKTEDYIDLKNEFKNHYLRKDNPDGTQTDLKDYIESGSFEEKTIVEKLKGYEIIIDLDELTTEKVKEVKPIAPKEKAQLKLKSDYRKGSKYVHDKYGDGIILSRKFVEEKIEDGIKNRYYNV